MGHSMGGAEILTYASTGPSDLLTQIRGFLAESPFIALHASARPNKLTVLAGRFASKVLPRLQMANQLNPEGLSRDPEVRKAYVEDELCHDTGTLEGLAGMLDRAEHLENGKVRVKEGVGEGGKTRIWVGHGTEDGACDFEATKGWFEKYVKGSVEDATLRVYDGWSHKCEFY